MSKKQWMVLLMLFLTYLLLGASIFYHIESRLEVERVEKARQERIEIYALLHAQYERSGNPDRDELLGKLTRYCGRSVYNYTEGEMDPLKWDFYNSFYFAYTVVSTIGYGNLAPTNMLGRILMIFYGLIGIPMNGILLTQLGEFFGHAFVKAHQKYKSYKRSRTDYYPRKLTTFETRKVGLAAQIFVYLTPGFIMFIFFPAFLFSHYEGWTYDEAVYYAFVTLTTIGFGDYVAGQDNSKGSGVFFIFYKTFLICWISFGLGYTVMIMTFIARGMRSKKITRIEHKLAVNLKHTQSKIWNEFNKEINYLRRVFNELQLSKVKRVYVDECDYEMPATKYPRSNSFPDLRDLLYGTKQDDTITHSHKPRRRANSEVVPTEDQMARVVSETDLQRIDKTATFAAHAMIQPAELLAKLVNILGYIPPATEDTGADCSNQTTVVEQDAQRNKLDLDWNGKEPPPRRRTTEHRESMCAGSPAAAWTIGNERISRFPRFRSRATSEVRLHETKNEDRKVEWTWSGATASRKIQELIKARTNELSSKDQGSKEAKFSGKLRGFSLARAVPSFISTGPWKNRFSSSASEKKSSETEHETNNRDIVGQSSFATGFNAAYPERDRRDSSSVLHSRRHYYTHTGTGIIDHPGPEGSNLLEETSVADFLRAITLLHASVTGNGSWPAATDDELRRIRPRRKMGTASLTPPKLPSLFTLFSPLSTDSALPSTHHVIAQDSNQIGQRNARRGSLAFAAPAIAKPRRFSLRPVATPISPPTPPKSNSPLLSDSRRIPYETKSTFLFESPKEPLIRTEGAPGLSSPIQPPSDNGRRFSLRAAQNHGAGSAGLNSTGQPPVLKAVPRWRAGMLQRQIGQMNLRRRVRAFSLSDVQTDDLNEKRTEHHIIDMSSPAACVKKNRGDLAQKNVSLRERLHEDGKEFAGSTENQSQLALPNDAVESENEPTIRIVPSYSRCDRQGGPCSDQSTALFQINRNNEPDKQLHSDSLTIANTRERTSVAASSRAQPLEPLQQVQTENTPPPPPPPPPYRINPTEHSHSTDPTEINIENVSSNSCSKRS